VTGARSLLSWSKPVGAALLALLLWAPAERAAAIEDQVLRYKALYGNINAGRLEVSIHREEAGYRVVSTGKPSALARLFRFNKYTTTTRFVRHRGEVALDSGTTVGRARGDEFTRSFRFNRTHDRIEFSDGEHSAIAPGERFEAAAFPLLLMLRPVETLEGARVREVSAWRAREYIYQQPVEEVVETPAGGFSSWKITRRRASRPADSVTVWLKQGDNPIPLKIAATRKGRTGTLLLTGTGT